MKAMRIFFLSCFSLFFMEAYSQVNPNCNDDDCGALDPSWQFTGNQTVACEGVTFFLRSGESVPYNNIDSYTWILENTLTNEELLNVTYPDTTLLEFLYIANDTIACEYDEITIEVRLVVTSPECAEGESCRYTAEPLTVVFKPRARFDVQQVVCVNAPVTITEASCNAETYAWDFDDDGITDSVDPIPVGFSYDATGTYTVSLTVTNDCGSDTATKTIQVVGYPEAEIDLDTGGEICAPGLQTITMIPNQWVTGPSGDFNWVISPGYTNMNGAWCFVDPSSNECLHDSNLTVNAVDSLLSFQEQLKLYFMQPGDYTVTLNFENVCGSGSVEEIIHVYEQPSASGFANQSGCDAIEVCFDDLNISVGGDYSAIEWIFTGGASSSGSSALDFGCVTFQSSGTMTLNLDAFDPCQDVSQTMNVTVVETTTVTVPDPVPNLICENAGLIFLNPSATQGDYLYNGSTASFISNDTLYPEGLNGNYTITYVLSDNPDCPAQDDFSFSIQAGPSIALGENDPVCESIANFNPAIASSGGDIDSWSWQILDSGGNVVANSASQFPGFSLDTAGTYTIIAELTSDECGSVTDTSGLVIQANVAVVIDPFDNPYCQGSGPDTLTASMPGGTWSGIGISVPDEGIFDPSLPPIPDDYPITYEVENGVCISTATQIIVVVASQIVTAPDTFFCITDLPVQLGVDPPMMGTFSGTGVTSQGVFDPDSASLGPNTISFLSVDANGCEVATTFNVDVDTIPEITSADTVFICIGNENIDISVLSNVGANGEQGEFSFSGPGIVNAGLGLFNGSGLDTGFYTIVVDFYARACVAQDSFVVELAELPDLIMPADTTICVSDGTFTLTANLGGGAWSSPDCDISAATGEIDLAAVGEEDCIFQYIVSAGTSCEQSGSVNVSILDLLNDIDIPSEISICYTTGLYTIPGFSPAGGTWSGEGIQDAQNGVIDVSVLEQGMSYTYSYCIESSLIECDACKEMVLTIEPLPVAAFELPEPPCEDEPFSVTNSSAGAVSYEWDFGDDSPPQTASQPTHTYGDAGTYQITLVAETDFGCLDTTVYPVHVTAPPMLILDIVTEEGCAPLAIEYTNNSFGENTSQYWIIGGVDTLYEAQPLIVLDSVTTDAVITLTLVVYNDCDTLTQSKDILVHPYPMVDFGINDDEGCSPDTVYFMNATLGDPDYLFWDFGNDSTSTLPNPPKQIYTTGNTISTYVITLYASNECGADTLSKEIVVYPNNVEAFFEIDTLSGCPPLAVTIQNYATIGAIVTYDFGDSTTGNTPNTIHVYEEPGQYVITQYASICGTDIFYSDTITVFPLATIDFELPDYVCIGESASFTNLSTGGLVSQWLFGDGATSAEVNPVHMYEAPGTYEVSLIVNSIFNDCPDTLTKTIIVPALPQAIFEPVPGEICPGEVVSFQNGSIGAVSYAWDFGDNLGTSTLENPQYPYTDPGAYAVTLTVFDQWNCSADTTVINMLVHPAPLSSFTLSAEEVCQFYDTIFTTNTSSGYVSSEWYLNDSLYADQLNDIAIAFQGFGMQELELISINAFGCRDTIQAAFEVLPSPQAAATFPDTAGCQALTLNFVDISQNNDLTKWVLEGNNTSTDSIATHTFTGYGSYLVALIAGNTNGCPSDTFYIDVDVFPRAVAGFELPPYDSCGVPVVIQMINTSELASDYQWDFGNNNGSPLFEPPAEYDNPGNYDITLIASNGFDCPDTAMLSLTIYPNVSAGLDVPETEICEGDTLVVINTSAGADAFQWVVNGEIWEEFPLVIAESGEYTLSLVASFGGVCFDTLPYQQIINVYDTPDADFLAIADEDQSIIGDVRFQNLSVDADAYLWDFGDGSNPSEEEHPLHEYNIDGPVTVTLFSYNTNNGDFECVDAISQLITFERINTFYVPNALSPDQGFGNQEVAVFKPKGIGIAEYELNIYSPWGDKIITLHEVFNGEPADFWDGTFRGEPVPQGAYLWTARVKYKSGHTDFKKGNVTVVR
jgi:PKD repeat protein